MDDERRAVLIVGGGVAAGACAAELRARDPDTRIVLVGSEPRPPYERPSLSKELLAGDVDVDDTYVHTPRWWASNDVELHSGRRVVDLGVDDHVATLDDGSRLGWDKVVLATGAHPVAPAIEGADLDGVHELRTLDQALALRSALATADHVAVVGASFIGSEVAAAARGHGCRVTMVDPAPTPLHATLGPVVGAAYAALHRDHGVALELGAGKQVTRVTGDDRADGVELADGTRVHADVVVLGTGVAPAVDLAERAGIAVGDGVLVDTMLRTSHHDVLAVGDVANHDHPLLGRVRAEHVEVARDHGRTAARVLCGEAVAHDDLPMFCSDQFDLGMEYLGHGGDTDDPVVRGDLAGRAFVAFYLDGDDTVRAGTHANTWAATGVVRRLIGRRVDRGVLADGDVPLVELPARAVVGPWHLPSRHRAPTAVRPPGRLA